MSENKTGKYLKYAIGEIFLVVIGILIALQINNWNENQKNKVKEKHYLTSLKEDIQRQISLFKKVDSTYTQILSVSNSIIEDFIETNDLTNIDSINYKLSVLMNSRKYPDINTTFNELNSTGQLAIIRDKSLRSEIISYYQFSENIKNSINSNIVEVFYPQVFAELKKAVMINPENFGIEMQGHQQQLLSDKMNGIFKVNLGNPNKQFEIINAINLRILLVNVNKSSLSFSKIQAEQLLKSINQVHQDIEP